MRNGKREWYRIRAQADAEAADVYLYDLIGQSWWEEESVTAKQFLKELQALPETVRTLRLHVNSPGGDPFDATAMYNLLRTQAEGGRTVEVLIEGLAASAATIVTSAGDSIKIARNALVMVHNPWGMVIGDAAEMRGMADALETMKGSIIVSYQRHSSLSDAELGALMDAQTWMNAEEALAKGFATELMDPLPVAARFDPRALRALGKVPRKVRARLAEFMRAQDDDEEDWTVGGARDLTLRDDLDEPYDEAAEEEKLQRWAGGAGDGSHEGVDWAKYRQGHVLYDANDPENFGSYKLKFIRVVDGDLVASRRALVVARGVLNGARGGIDVPEDAKEAAKRFVNGYLGPEEGEEEDKADAIDVLKAVEKAGLGAEFARGLIEEALPMDRVRDRIAASVQGRERLAAREKEIRALCALAKCPEMAGGYLGSDMPVDAVKAQLAIITAKMDAAEVDGALLPSDGKPGKPKIDVQAVYRDRNRLATTKKEG